MREDWKGRIANIVNICQGELNKTKEIGKKMLMASKTNSCLHEAYEDLGQLVARALREKRIDWEDKRALALLETINKCEQELEEIENEVKKIKIASSPQDVSKKRHK